MNVLKSTLRVGIPIVVVLVSAGSTYLLLRSLAPLPEHKPHSSVAPPRVVAKKPQVIAPGLPVRLKIPKIQVDAAVEGLGLTPEGDLDAPKGADTTGWYNAGPRPGGQGSAVIDGHFGWANNKPAVFDNLHTLRKGDLLHVEDEKGATHTFVVSELRSYQPEDDASAVFRSNDGRAHLNLITCQGVWNKQEDGYSARLVVFADRVVE